MLGFKKFLIIYFVILFFSLAGFVLAQRQLEVNYPEIGGIKPTVTTISLPQYVKYIFDISIAIAGLIAFGVLVSAGFRYATSAGNMAAMKDAQERIGGAILGLLILLSSYLILTTINPQLTFFNLPGLKGIGDFPLIGAKPADSKTLRVLEIPLGKLIKEALNTNILDGISGLLAKIKTDSQEIKKTAEELKGLTDSCSCGSALPNASSCDYSQNCPATGCLGEPCPDRAAIKEKAEEARLKAGELKALLENKKEKDGKSGLKELTDNLIKNFQNLDEAEAAIKSCSGRGRTLMGATDFDNYQRSLKNSQKIEKIEIDRKFWPKLTASDYFMVFYCVEEPLQAATGEEKIPEVILKFPEGDIPKSKVFCQEEIPLGETVDVAENLAGQIIKEVQSIIGNFERIITAGQDLSGLASECKGSEACSTGCNQYLIPNPDICVEKTICPEENGPGFNPSCQPECLKYEPVPDTEACGVIACGGSVCPNSEIGSQVTVIGGSSSQIETSLKIFDDLINKKEKNKTQAEEIMSQLAISSKGTDNCYNSAEKLQRVLAGGKELIKELIPCKLIKELTQNQIYFYNEKTGGEIKDCYGQEPGKDDRLDNYFCCQSETGF